MCVLRDIVSCQKDWRRDFEEKCKLVFQLITDETATRTMSLNVSTNRNAQSANAVAGPSTPRRFRDPSNNNSQATPARRQTLTPSRHIPSPTTLMINGSQQPLPELNFPPLPTRIVAMSSKVRETIESDMAAWDAALRLARERKSDKKRRHEQMKNDLLEEERRWQQECERLRREGADVVKGEVGLSPCQCMHG